MRLSWRDVDASCFPSSSWLDPSLNSVDAAWVVPHFEKMLNDNAQLMRVYLHWHRATGSDLAARVVRETAEFLLRDLGTAHGGFASALDADTDGVEGLTYVWSPA